MIKELCASIHIKSVSDVLPVEATYGTTQG